MATNDGAANPTGRGRLARAAQVIIVSSVMFSFISYWRLAAVVLCDLASTAYYIGAIVEQAVGPAAPWFILAVMVFSYAVRSVYIESCALFVRGGVYRVVKEAMGGVFAKLSVSALMFDFILTGPISSVTAGQYIVGLFLELGDHYFGVKYEKAAFDQIMQYGSMFIAIVITLYFLRQNLLGIHESSGKAMNIMIATTVMAAIAIGWCVITLIHQGPANWPLPLEPQLIPRPDPTTGVESDPLGFLSATGLADKLRTLHGSSWLSIVGLLGVMIAFGHSILAMSGEETLAQVYREVESPKLPNFKKAAFIVFVYSLVLTAGISFLAVMLIPNDERMAKYSGNLIGGLAMQVWGPVWAKFALNFAVVFVGFLILAGAVNTAIIGSNGVLNRVAEDGVMPDWLLRPHPRFGTTSRVLYLVAGLQLATILVTRGNIIWLGEAYAFGVVWSFVFNALAMVVLRFKDRTPREFKVPLNFRVRGVEIPVGLILIFLVLAVSALLNLLTKEVATISGAAFTTAFFTLFMVSEHYHEKRRQGTKHEHLEQFNRQSAADINLDNLHIEKPYRKLVAIRSPHNLHMLEKALAETDPATTAVVVMTAKQASPSEFQSETPDLDSYDQQLMTAVVQRAERAGKEVKPLIIPTNNPLYAVLRTARDLQVQELIMGASNKYTADEQLEQIAFYWFSLHQDQPAPLTVRILSRDRDVHLDLAGGNRIPKISERQARSVAELRAAGIGVDRVLLMHDGSPASSDLYQAVLTMLDPQVALALIPIVPVGNEPHNGHGVIHQDEERARKLGREVTVLDLPDQSGTDIVRMAREQQFDLIIVPIPAEPLTGTTSRLDARAQYLLEHAHCRVFLAASAVIPQEPVPE